MKFPNVLAHLGHTGSFHWPNQFIMRTSLDLGEVGYYGKFKKVCSIEVICFQFDSEFYGRTGNFLSRENTLSATQLVNILLL